MPPAIPQSAADASPGPLTAQPITATVMGLSTPLQPLLHLGSQADQIDAGPPTGGTGDQLCPLPPDPGGLQDVPGRVDLLHRVGGEGDPHGVPDPLGQQAPDAHRRLQGAHPDRPGLGNANM